MEVNVSHFVEIRKPLERVWKALTTEEELKQWFDPAAHIDLREGGSLNAPGKTQFRGKFIQGRLQYLEPPEELVWEFPLLGDPSEVIWNLSPSPTGTRVVVNHIIPQGAERLLPPREGKEAAFHYWFQNLACLKYWLDAGLPPNRIPLRELPQSQADVSLTLPVPTDRLWRFMTIPSELDNWVSKKAEVELQERGKFNFGWDHGAQQLVELVPGARLKFSWHYRDEETFVTWSVAPTDDNTMVRIQHAGFKPGTDSLMLDYHEGWLTFLHALGVYTLTGDPLNRWFGAGE